MPIEAPTGNRRFGLGARAALMLGAALLVGGCSGHGHVHWQTKHIAGVMPDLHFTLTDTDGDTVHAKHYFGKINLLYFGYTHCPDVCPTTLAKVEEAFHKMGPLADRVRMLFVSVDPARDSPKTLGTYVQPRPPHRRPDRHKKRTHGPHQALPGGLPLRQKGQRRQLPRVSQRRDFAFDPKGHVQLVMTYKAKVGAMAHDLKALAAR